MNVQMNILYAEIKVQYLRYCYYMQHDCTLTRGWTSVSSVYLVPLNLWLRVALDFTVDGDGLVPGDAGVLGVLHYLGHRDAVCNQKRQF